MERWVFSNLTPTCMAKALLTSSRHLVFGTLLALGLSLSASAFADNKDIVINEIMYHPPEDKESLQYIELFNRGQATVDLSNWSFAKGITYSFPANTKLEPGGFLVV